MNQEKKHKHMTLERCLIGCIEFAMPATTEQAVIMLSSHFYESRDGSTGGFFADNTGAAQQVWNTVNLLLRLDRDWKV